uniref:Uncharacterized protein n=1 Tax=Arundo donax TaxID=35708 RepID=A0A0A9CQ06_ARUDO
MNNATQRILSVGLYNENRSENYRDGLLHRIHRLDQ